MLGLFRLQYFILNAGFSCLVYPYYAFSVLISSQEIKHKSKFKPGIKFKKKSFISYKSLGGIPTYALVEDPYLMILTNRVRRV